MQPTVEQFLAAVNKFYFVKPGTVPGEGGSSATAVPGGIDWGRLGRDVLPLTLEPPRLTFMLGPLAVEAKVRKGRKAAEGEEAAAQKERNRKAREELKKTVDYERAEELNKEELAQVEAAGSQRGAQMALWLLPLQSSRGVNLRCSDGKIRRVLPMIDYLFDPWSYTQTVENLFYFSYLVKGAAASVFMGPSTHAPGVTVPYLRVLTDAQVQAKITSDDAGSVYEPDAEVEAELEPELAAALNESSASAGGSSRAAKKGGGAGGGGALALKSAAHQFVLHIEPASWAKIVAQHGLKAPRMVHRKTNDSAAPKGFKYQEYPPVPSARSGAASSSGEGDGAGKARGKGAKGSSAASSSASPAPPKSSRRAARKGDDTEDEGDEDGEQDDEDDFTGAAASTSAPPPSKKSRR